jgi:hypothetical protein
MDNHFSGFGLQAIPIWLTVENSRYYEEVPVTRTEDEALDLAYAQLEMELGTLSSDAQLLRKEIVTTLTEDALILDCTVLCVENIAEQLEFEVVTRP